MEKLIKANLDCLPNVPIHIIISYLRTSEVLGSLCLVSRYFFKLLAGSKPALVSCILDVIGTTPESKKRVNELSPDALKFLLARGLPLLWKKCYELPFYGYAADKGCDQNEYFFSFHEIFIKRKTQSELYSSKSSAPCHIAGALAWDYLYLQDSLDKLKMAGPPLQKTYLEYKNYHTSARKTVKGVLKQHFDAGEDPSDLSLGNNIEITCFPIVCRMGIIAGFDVIRPRDYTCPVKTLMLFVSEEPLPFNDPVMERFNSAQKVEDVLNLYSSEILKEVLPEIYYTNVPILQHLMIGKYPKKPLDEAIGSKLIIFSNKCMNSTSCVRPVIWLEIAGESGYAHVNIRLPKSNLFCGNYVALKMLAPAMVMPEPEPNIDISLFRITGTLLEDGESLLPVLTKVEKPIDYLIKPNEFLEENDWEDISSGSEESEESEEP